jgi:hypothetical protein
MASVVHALYHDASLDSILGLIQRGRFSIDYQHRTRDGSSLLIIAIEKRREDVVVELIRLGANVELANSSRITPLALACAYNLVSTVHALVQAGADINAPYTSSPLGCAAARGHLPLVQKLLSWGADPSRSRKPTARFMAQVNGQHEMVQFLDVSGSVMVLCLGQVRRISARSALKFLPKDMCRLVLSMLL